MDIKLAKTENLPEIKAIYGYARQFMRESGNPNQWGNNRPAMETVAADISQGNFYVAEEAGAIVGCFAMFMGPDPTYEVIREGEWLNGDEYVVIHRVASNGKAHHLLEKVLAFADGKYPGINNIRMDTHYDNKIMQHLLEKNGFRYCGIINTDDGTERMAYQRVMEKGQRGRTTGTVLVYH